MLDFIMKYWLQVGFGVILGAMGLMASYFKVKLSEVKALKTGVRALLKDRIWQAHRHFTKERKYITPDELAQIEGLHAAYKGLGGNDTGDEMYREIQRLPKYKTEGGK